MHACMQATAVAITKGECMHSQAISEVLTEAGAEFDAYSTCGEIADVLEAEPAVVEEEIKAANEARDARKLAGACLLSRLCTINYYIMCISWPELLALQRVFAGDLGKDTM